MEPFLPTATAVDPFDSERVAVEHRVKDLIEGSTGGWSIKVEDIAEELEIIANRDRAEVMSRAALEAEQREARLKKAREETLIRQEAAEKKWKEDRAAGIGPARSPAGPKPKKDKKDSTPNE